MRAALYCRVSSAAQAKEGDSIPAQLDALNKYANERKYQIIGTFVDDGVSGTKYDRDEFQSLLQMVENDQVDIILVTKMDRLHRSLRNFLNMQDTLDRHHCHWKAIWEPSYDTTTPQGRMVINMMMNLAQFEAEQTGQRVRQVNAHKVQKREVISGSTTPGYSIVNKHLVVNEDAAIVRKAFEVFDRTNSIAEAVRATAGTNLPATKSGMRYMLQREVYIGKAHGVEDFCEPIIDKELFDRVQLALSRNIKSGQKRTFLFSGLIKCAECGYTYSAQAKKSGKKDWLYYRCPKKYNEVVKKCTNKKIINESTFERRLIGMLPSMVVEQVEMHEEKQRPVISYEKQKAALEKKIERLKVLFVNDEISLEEYRVDKATLMKQIEELAPVTPSEPPQAILALQGLNISEIYEMLTKEEKRRFWRGIIKEIRVDHDGNIFYDFL